MTNQRRHTPKLRLLSAFLAAAMAMTTLPVAAFAEDVTDYGLTVNGVQVTSANANDILGDGKASYVNATRTLTLNGEIAATNNAVNPFGEQLTVTGESTVTGAQRDHYAGFYCGGKPIVVAADANITLDTFGFGITAAGADIFGAMKIRNAEYGIGGNGATVESYGKLVIQNADNAVSGGGAKVYGTLEIDDVGTAVSDAGVTVYEGGVVTITGADSGLNGGSAVNGGALSVSAKTCIDNGAVTFTSGTLKLDSTNNQAITLSKLTVNAADFWYRTAKDGAWTQVTGGSWTRPSDTAYFEITTEDPTVTHYTVTFDLNGGTRWGTNDYWISQAGGKWNDDLDQVSFTTYTGDSGEGLSVNVGVGMGPHREGHEFVGWYTAAVGGEPVEEQPYYMQQQHLEPITEDITLYAHWQQNGEDVALNETNFPDYVFLNYVKQFDKDSDGALSAEERDAVTKIDTGYMKSIEDLTGIEHFPNLKILECYNNQLTALDVSRNPALEKLICSGNQLTQLDVSQNPQLFWLDCSANQLTQLDVSKNTALTRLNCSQNQLTKLDVSQNAALDSLNCDGNQLAKLDVSSNTELTSLDCSINQLDELDVSQHTKLTQLGCYENQLTQLDVSKNTELTYLNCSANQLTKLDVSQHTKLTYLGCYENQLTQLDVSKNTELIYLDCSANHLSSLDLSQNTKLIPLNGTSCEGCQRNIELDAFGQFDLSTLPGFDPSKATWPEGVTAAGSILTVPEGIENIIYEYDAGNGHTLWFCLTASRSEAPDPIIPDDPEAPDSSADGAAAAIAVTALGGAAVWGGYELATRVILNHLLPEGTAIPRTRGELALLLWQNAGRPEPSAQPAFADVADAETAKAAQWCAEQGLLTAEDGAFRPEQRVTKYRVIQVWKQAAANAE